MVVERNGCQITQLVKLDAVNPPTLPSPIVTVQNESCGSEGVSGGTVSIDFERSISAGEYRVLEIGRGEIGIGQIPSNGQASFTLTGGSYLLEIKEGGCTYPIQEIVIGNSSQVEFTVPTALNICETFTLIPDTGQNLSFTLTYPDGSTETVSSGNGFTLTEPGTYSILGIGQNANASLCPKKIEFTATLSSSISFSPFLAVEKCFDPIKYGIDLQGIAIEDASIRWLNDEGDIVGRGREFFPTGLGNFSLLVQPLQSGFCPVSPVEFEVVAPITEVPMDLEATKICPNPNFARVTLSTNEEEVTETEWIFYGENDQRQELTANYGLFEIEVTVPGTYEAVAYNRLGCEIGRNFILVEESELLTLPMLDEKYGVCSEGKKKAPYWTLENLLGTFGILARN